jgi:hypothetical protein
MSTKLHCLLEKYEMYLRGLEEKLKRNLPYYSVDTVDKEEKYIDRY